MTYWLYTYIPWFYPFAALALLAPAVPLRKLVTQECEAPASPVVDDAYPDREAVLPRPSY